ncbi:hypothetical protein Y032_0044g984 [Ancylostoma ceylanicum]|uniref:Uncharacterized protein n=1 Tax=Ancylostoma ceylanicum TaxID=53326 RepID=A0A016UEZ3_9BILA|nr:hypothetical protein Y032_0044g984 [Ancylostoma ceylanicum]
MTEDLSERVELIASISSQVAEGVGPLIMQIVEKRFEEKKQLSAKQSTVQVPTHASLLSKWITDIEEIESTEDPDDRNEKISTLKRNLKRRLTTVVGADTDSSIFQLADAYDKVKTVIDQSDEFGKVVADHLKKSASMKSQETREKQKWDRHPFRTGGYS